MTDQITAPGPAKGRGAGLIFILIMMWIDVLSWSVSIPVYPRLFEQFTGGDISKTALLVVVFSTGFALIQLFAAPVLGALSDHYGRRPVILIRTPYGKGNGESAEGKYFAAHGYVVILQDTRGRFRSEGVWHFLTDDGQDGYDCADWIVAQPWSNGRIGMMGTSYVGGTQHALAMSGSPNLATVIPVDAVSNMGRQSMRNAGAFELRFWNWIISHSGEGSRQVRDPATAAVLAICSGCTPPSFAASKAHSSVRHTASMRSMSKSCASSFGAGASGAPMRSQKVRNCAAVTFERWRATA